MMRRAMMSGFASGTSLPLRRVRLAGTGLPPPPGINCQATQDGGAICSEGTGFSPTCPKKPEPNVPGVAEYRQEGNVLIPIPPPPPGAAPGVAPAGTAPAAPAPVSPAAASQFAASACPMAAINAGVAAGGVTAPIATGPVPLAPTPTAPAAPAAPVAAAPATPLPPPPPPVMLPATAFITTANQKEEGDTFSGLAALAGVGLLVYLLLK